MSSQPACHGGNDNNNLRLLWLRQTATYYELCRVAQSQWWDTHSQWQLVPHGWSWNGKTSLSIPCSGARRYMC